MAVSDDDLIRRGDALEILENEGWVGNSHKTLSALPAALAVPEVRALEKEALRLKASLWAIGHAAGIETKEDLMQAALAALRQIGGEA